MSRPTGSFSFRFFYDFLARVPTLAAGMPEAAAADAVLNIENQIVAGTRRDAHGHRI